MDLVNGTTCRSTNGTTTTNCESQKMKTISFGKILIIMLMSMYGTEIDEIDPSPLLSRKTKKIYKAVADIQKTRIQASCSKNKKAMPTICSS